MTSQSSLKEGKLKEETPKTKETCHKDGKGLPPQEQATFLPKREAKGRGDSIPQTLPVYPRLPQPDR